MQRLFLNLNSYQGERIEIEAVLERIDQLAVAAGWRRQPIQVAGQRMLPTYHRPGRSPGNRIYLSAGIHGDEPAGPLAMLRLFLRDEWPEDLNLWVAPCLNPEGFRLNRREDAAGVDLNRDYRSQKTAVVRAHCAWLERQPNFDLTLLLHEDWEAHGFYLYELNPDRLPSLAGGIIRGVKEVCPVDLSPVIEGRAAQGGVICANADLPKRTDWPEAFYLIHHKTRLNYTLESPSDFPLATRVNALTTGVWSAFQVLAEPATAEDAAVRDWVSRAAQ